ncbi:hypothetical protein Sste5344_006713 [Sporothrix stenoceras]
MVQADDITRAVLDEFDKLPTNRKPAARSNGIHEWVPLSGIVAELSKLSQSKGIGIHDWHAEVLALRAFNRFVLQECRDVLLQGDESPFVQFRAKSDETAKNKDGVDDAWNGQPFEWREDVSLHMYCSEAPCKIDAPMK